jgi:PAS domain S-box-containing protein
LTVAYFGCAELSLNLTRDPNVETSFWLPSGLILGALLLTHPSQWWAVLAALVSGDFLYAVSEPSWPWWAWSVVISGNGLSAITGAWLLRRFGARPVAMERIIDLAALVGLGAFASLTISATIGAMVLRALGVVGSFGEVWASWYFSDVVGVMLVAPLLLAWGRPAAAGEPPWRWSRWLEASLLAVGVAAVLPVTVLVESFHGTWVRYAVIPFVLWAGIRFGVRGLTLVSLAIALILGWLALHGHDVGMMVWLSNHTRNAELQASLAVMACFGLVPAIVIAAHRRMEVQLREQRNFLKAIFDSEPECVAVLSPGGELLQMNAAGLEMHQAEDVAAVRAHGLANFVRPDFRERYREVRHGVMAGEDGLLLFPITGLRGASRWLDQRAVPLRDSAGLISGMLCVTRDVTQRVQIEEQLRIARFTVDRASVPMFWVDREAKIEDTNDAACRLLGYSREEILRMHVAEIDPEYSAERWPVHWAELRESKSLSFQSRHRRKDGVILDVIVSTHHLGSEGRDLLCAFVQDITDRKRAEEARRQTEERLKLIFATVAEGIVVQDTQLAIVECNASAGRILGLTAGQMAGRTSLDRRWHAVREDGSPFPGEEHPAAVTLRTGAPARDVIMGIHQPNGQLGWISINTEPLRDAAGRVELVVASFSEITSRKMLQDQVRHSQKMEVVGQLAGGVAHDFNNILTAVLLNLQLMETEPALPVALQPRLEDLKAMALRAAALTEQLLLFARRRTLQTHRHELNAGIANVLKMLRRVLGEPVTINLLIGAADLWIEADSGMIDQVVMNLCVNARDAMPGGGTLTIETMAVSIDAAARRDLVHPAARPGDFARLRISDTGCGMAAEVRRHLFEPFFTTKPVGKGTGLGLATVHGIVEQHQGWVEVTSVEGRGSTFLVYLPLARPRAAAEPAAARPKVRGGGETILLVEDEPALRFVGGAMLRQVGYRVIEAGDGPEALRIWAEHGGSVQLVITDMVMPGGLTGLQLGLKLREARPNLPFIIISGYNDEILKRDQLAARGIGFLSKPFEFEPFAATVRAALE